MPQQGPAYDVLVNETRPMPMQEGREGYMGTYTDPATGDIITDVVSPRMPQQQQQQTPIIVYPQVGSPYAPVPNEGGYNIQYGSQYNGTPGWQGGQYHGGPQRPPHVDHRPGGHPAGTPPPGLMPHSGSGVRPGGVSPHASRHPNLPGNKVEHRGYSMPGGNPGNMDRYRPAHPGGGRP